MAEISRKWPSVGGRRPHDPLEHAAILRQEMESIIDHLKSKEAGMPNLKNVPTYLFHRIFNSYVELTAKLKTPTALETHPISPDPKVSDTNQDSVASGSADHSKIVHRKQHSIAKIPIQGELDESESDTNCRRTPVGSRKDVKGPVRGPTQLLEYEIESDYQESEDQSLDDDENDKVYSESEQCEERNVETKNLTGDEAEYDVARRDVKRVAEDSHLVSEDHAGQSESDDCSDGEMKSKESDDEQIVKKEGLEALRDNSDGGCDPYTQSITFSISQDTLSQLKIMQLPEIFDKLNLSLRRVGGCHSGPVSFSALKVSDSDLIEFVVHAATKYKLSKPILSKWQTKFQRQLWRGKETPKQTFTIKMKCVERAIMDLKDYRRKRQTIKELMTANREFVQKPEHSRRRSASGLERHCKDIKNIYWPPGSKASPTAPLVIEFSTPESANEAIDLGLSWKGKNYHCVNHDQWLMLRFCEVCLRYGHTQKSCSQPARCTKCAGRHSEAQCDSTISRCATCAGNHRADARICPARRAAKENRFFPTASSPQPRWPFAKVVSAVIPKTNIASINGPDAEATNSPPNSIHESSESEASMEVEEDQSGGDEEPKEAGIPDTATLMKQLKDLEQLVKDRDKAIQEEARKSWQRRLSEKRKAVEPLTSGALKEHANDGKRIKIERSE